MTQERKDFLLKDLCARLPYGVIVDIKYNKEHGSSDRLRACSEGSLTLNANLIGLYIEEEIHLRLYLRSLLSINDEEFQELHSICPHVTFNKTNEPGWIVGIDGSEYGRISRIDEISKLVDWLNSHHFDYRGLIQMGLALEAPEGMYNIK